MAVEQFITVPYKTREEWLKLRVLGGSSASAILGENPFKTNIDCWEELVKKKKGELIKEEEGNERTVYGTLAEAPRRELFKLNYPEYEVLHDDEVLISKHYDFITASLDGKLIHKLTNKKGIYEGKTVEVNNKMILEHWGKREVKKVPQHYYIQLLHYMYVTGWDFAILDVQFRYHYEDEGIVTVSRIYYWEREEMLRDMKYLISKEVEFWEKYVIPEIQPPRIIKF